MRVARSIIVGSRDDVHVANVLEYCDSQSTLVVDGESLSHSTFAWSDAGLTLEFSSERWMFPASAVARGWVRRLAPETWQQGVIAGSPEAAEHAAWLSLLAALGRSPLVAWLTKLDDNLIAENKIHQLAVAARAGVRTPRTVVSNDSRAVAAAVPGERVVKTLGPGHYFQGDTARVVFTQGIDDADLVRLDGGLPLVFQERLDAIAHLRIVVVQNRVWAFELNASALPLDWRADPAAHHSFVAISTPREAEDGARRVAHALHLGYASQDWIVTSGGPILIDVNPGGQWLFLPEPESAEVTQEIARWLGGQVD